MKKIRVMIVDDSVVIRRLLADVLSGDPEIEVVGAAANGKIAMAKLALLAPDLVTLDIEMPEMDGLETLRAIRAVNRTLPTIMFSTLTERGASATLEALGAGASDYVTKPANVGGITQGMARIRGELLPKIKALCARVPRLAATPARPAVAAPTFAARPLASGAIDVVAIGVSTGGPEALAKLLPMLPRDLPASVLITQHMPPMFTRLLANRLATKCALPVREAVAGEAIKPGEVLIAPGDFHLTVERVSVQWRVALSQRPPENSCRPAVDVMFRSIAAALGARAMGVILTGMGSDGLKGAEAMRAKGSTIFAQDEATSVVWGMPGFVARASLADRVLPLDQIAGEIVRRVRNRGPLAIAS